jgi:ParB family chromosome partitioning protein
MTRKALGRGLSALIGEAEATDSALQPIPVDLIDPNPFQPRRLMAEDRLKELAESIQSTGVVQPVLVRKVGDRYQLVAGERRWRAACHAKLQTIPAIVRDLQDREALEIALTENILREDLSPIEVAHAYQALHEKFGYSHEEISTRLGFDRSTVTNTLRLLKLPAEVQELIENKLISSGHARAILSCSTLESQIQLAKKIVKDGLSVRQAERLAALLKPEAAQKDAQEPVAQKEDPNTRAAILELERALGTRVKIVGDENRGRIEISYYSAQDLQRLYERIIQK